MNNENIISVYNRTYNNCKFYLEKGDKERLLNEIGALRGIIYCIGATIGEDNINSVINTQQFLELIDKQNKLFLGK